MDNYVNDNLKLQLNLQFFAKDGPGGEKTEPATAKKLDDVRKNGQTAKSKELITSISLDRKSTRLNSSHMSESRMPSSA